MRSFMICAAQSNNIQGIKSTRKRWVGHVASMRDRRDVYKALAGKPEGKRPLGKTQA